MKEQQIDLNLSIFKKKLIRQFISKILLIFASDQKKRPLLLFEDFVGVKNKMQVEIQQSRDVVTFPPLVYEQSSTQEQLLLLAAPKMSIKRSLEKSNNFQ